MRKSVLAMAAVAAMGASGAANATFFTVVNASAQSPAPGSTWFAPSPFVMDTAGIGTTLAGGSNSMQVLTDAAAAGIGLFDGASPSGLGALGTAIGTDTLSYFGLSNGMSDGYFGIAFRASAEITLTINLNANSNNRGIFTGIATDAGGMTGWEVSTSPVGTYGDAGASGGIWSGNSIALAAGDLLVGIFAGLGVGSNVEGAVTRFSGLSTFNVQYLDFDGSNWSAIQSSTGHNASQLNIATYSIPVPAPMLLAGAGLIGAAALRRRMVKKA